MVVFVVGGVRGEQSNRGATRGSGFRKGEFREAKQNHKQKAGNLHEGGTARPYQVTGGGMW